MLDRDSGLSSLVGNRSTHPRQSQTPQSIRRRSLQRCEDGAKARSTPKKNHTSIPKTMRRMKMDKARSSLSGARCSLCRVLKANSRRTKASKEGEPQAVSLHGQKQLVVGRLNPSVWSDNQVGPHSILQPRRRHCLPRLLPYRSHSRYGVLGWIMMTMMMMFLSPIDLNLLCPFHLPVH